MQSWKLLISRAGFQASCARATAHRVILHRGRSRTSPQNVDKCEEQREGPKRGLQCPKFHHVPAKVCWRASAKMEARGRNDQCREVAPKHGTDPVAEHVHGRRPVRVDVERQAAELEVGEEDGARGCGLGAGLRHLDLRSRRHGTRGLRLLCGTESLLAGLLGGERVGTWCAQLVTVLTEPCAVFWCAPIPYVVHARYNNTIT